MWFSDVNVPTELAQAARTGRLVVFVGAGASRDEPAGQPDFRQLIPDVGARYDETTLPWEMLVDEDLATTLCSTAAAGYARMTAVKDASALRVMLGCCQRVGLVTYEELQHARALEVTWGEHRTAAGHHLS